MEAQLQALLLDRLPVVMLGRPRLSFGFSPVNGKDSPCPACLTGPPERPGQIRQGSLRPAEGCAPHSGTPACFLGAGECPGALMRSACTGRFIINFGKNSLPAVLSLATGTLTDKKCGQENSTCNENPQVQPSFTERLQIFVES